MNISKCFNLKSHDTMRCFRGVGGDGCGCEMIAHVMGLACVNLHFYISLGVSINMNHEVHYKSK